MAAAPMSAPAAPRGAPAPAPASPAGAAGAAQPPPRAAADRFNAPGFRETLWFKKGELDSLTADLEEPMAPEAQGPTDVPEEERPLSERYVDDGSISGEEARKYSLRTGKTEMNLPVVRDPMLPGAGKYSTDAFIKALNRPTKLPIYIVLGVALLGAVALILWLFLGESK
jgi:hypothetical protein